MSTATAGHAAVHGLDLHYEIHGTGSPVVLLHGGVNPAETFGAPLAALARQHRVIAVYLQGHGKTPDVDRSLRYESMADDVAALLGTLGIVKADVVGYSLGAGVALQTAIRHPAAVDRLIVISAPYARDGFFPEVVQAFGQMDAHAPAIAANVQRSPLATLYPAVHWEPLFRKIGALNSRAFDWSEAVARITAPTLLVYADADAVRPEHVVDFYRRLGGGLRDAGQDGAARSPNRLAVVPGTTHYTVLASDLTMRAVIDFLAR